MASLVYNRNDPKDARGHAQISDPLAEGPVHGASHGNPVMVDLGYDRLLLNSQIVGLTGHILM